MRRDRKPGDPARLEGRIDEVLSWGLVLRHMDSTPHAFDGGELAVIGEALDTLANLMADDLRAMQAKCEDGK